MYTMQIPPGTEDGRAWRALSPAIRIEARRQADWAHPHPDPAVQAAVVGRHRELRLRSARLTPLIFVCVLIAIIHWPAHDLSPGALGAIIIVRGLTILGAIAAAVSLWQAQAAGRLAAPNLFALARADATTREPLRVRRSRSSVLLPWIYPVLLLVLVAVPAKHAIDLTAETMGRLAALLVTMVIGMVAIPLFAFLFTMVVLTRPTHRHTILVLDESGVTITDLNLTVAWDEVQRVHCAPMSWGAVGPATGLYVQLRDPATTLGRSTRHRWTMRFAQRAVRNQGGSYLVTEAQLGLPMLEVLSAAVRLHRAHLLSASGRDVVSAAG